MLAYILRGGGRAALEEVPTPEPEPGEVRLRVRATALNHLDLFARQGLTGPGIREHRYPHVSGTDIAGDVDALGPGVESIELGERVVVYPGTGCGTCRHCRAGEISMCVRYAIIGEQRWGGLAEHTVVPAANVVPVPLSLDVRLAAATPAAVTTAWRLVMTAGGCRAGETVLVVGIGGGVATAALQIARLAGAKVLVTSGHDWKLARARELGAAGGVNHHQQDVHGWVMEQTDGEGVDLVVDSVGAPTWRTSIRCLAMGGRLCICGATGGDTPDISIRELYQSHRRVIGAPMGGWPDFLAVMRHVIEGTLAPVVHATYPLARVEDAFAELEAGAQFGKIVIQP
jgi:NADPH:quinone reductase-like Zn-dependent oxidoreductase